MGTFGVMNLNETVCLSLCSTEFCCCGLWLRVRYPPSCLKNKGWRCNANEIQVKWPQMQFHKIMTVCSEYLIWRTPSHVTFVVQTAGSLLSVALWGRIYHYPSLQIALHSLLFLTKVIFGIPIYQMHSSSSFIYFFIIIKHSFLLDLFNSTFLFSTFFYI